MNQKDYTRYLQLKKDMKKWREEIKELKFMVKELKVAIENPKHKLKPEVLVVLDKLKEVGVLK